MAGVPRASLVVIAATLNQFNIPEAGLLLILGVDTFLDMGRSATNVVGNSLATAVVAKWEGEDADTRAARPGRLRRASEPPRHETRRVPCGSLARSSLAGACWRCRARRAGGARTGALDRHAEEGHGQRHDHAGLPRELDSVLLPQPHGRSRSATRSTSAARSSRRRLDRARRHRTSSGFVPVTSENRFARVSAGEVDLECGSTTATSSARRRSPSRR